MIIDRFLIKKADIEPAREALVASGIGFGMGVIDGIQGKSIVTMESDAGNTLTGWGFPSTGNETLTEEEADDLLEMGF